MCASGLPTYAVTASMPCSAITGASSSVQRRNASSQLTSRHVVAVAHHRLRAAGRDRGAGDRASCPSGQRWPLLHTSSRSARISSTWSPSTWISSPHIASHSGQVRRCDPPCWLCRGHLAILAWMSGPNRAVLGTTIAESTPYHEPRPGPPAGAPNVVVIVLDDLGFAQLGCFGSDIATPAIDGLAAGGLRYNRFHVTSLCSPTRACLLTGRNHHPVGMGFLTDIPIGFPGYNGRIPDGAATLPRILRDNGYCHVRRRQVAPGPALGAVAPRARSTAGRSVSASSATTASSAGDTNQWTPDLVSDNGFVDPPARPEDGYHLTEDLADRAQPPDPRPAAGHAGQAVLPLLRDRRDARAAPRARGVDRPLPRARSTTAGRRGATARFARQVDQGIVPRRTDAARRGRRGCRSGTSLAARRAAAVRPHDGGVRRLPQPHRRADRPAARRSSRRSARSTTPSCC